MIGEAQVQRLLMWGSAKHWLALFPLVVILVGVALSLGLWSWLSAQQSKNLQSIQDARARAFGYSFEAHIDTATSAVARAAAWWNTQDDNHPTVWRDDARTVLRDVPFFTQIQWIDHDLNVRWHISRAYETWNAGADRALTPSLRAQLAVPHGQHDEVAIAFTRNAAAEGPQLEVFVPVRKDGAFDGFIQGSIDLRQMTKEAYIETALVSNLRLYYDDMLVDEVGDAPAADSDATTAAGRIARSSLQLRLQLTASPRFFALYRSHTPLAVLCIVLAATGLFSMLAFQYSRLTAQEAALRRSASELHESKEEISAHMAHVESIYAIVPVGLCLLDTNLRHVYINERLAELYEHPAERLVGRTPRDILPEMAEKLEPYLKYVLEKNSPVESVEIVHAASAEGATPRYWMCSFHPAHDTSGAVNGLVISTLEITSLKEAEQEKLELNARFYQAQKVEALGRLTGGVAHDFNNMLGVILGSLEFVKEKTSGDPAVMKTLRRIELAAEHSAGLIDQLLVFARKQPMAPRNANIGECLEDLLPLLERSVGAAIEVRICITPPLWLARVDVSLLGSAILNLVINARDAMPNGGKITINIANVILDENYVFDESEVVPGDYISVSVSDTGLGMPLETKERAFEPFFTTKAKGKGSGLGLSMVFGFIKQSSGYIKIDSEVGHGTVVKLYLPRASADAVAATPRPTEQVERGTEKILVLEDDALVRETAVRQLTALGYTILEACNGTEALHLLEKDRDIDLLFTDVVMPGGLTGPDVAKVALERRPDLKVLFVSGYTDNALIDQGWNGAGMPLLHKPYRRADLAAKIRKALHS